MELYVGFVKHIVDLQNCKMSTIKNLYIALLTALPLLGSAQQWEIDFSDHEFASEIYDGVLAQDGTIIAIGNTACDSVDYNPFLIHLYPDGSYYEYQYYDIPNFTLNSIIKLNNGNYMALGAALNYDGNAYHAYKMGCIVFSNNLEVISTKLYETNSIVTEITNIKAIIDDDGTVVVCGGYNPGSSKTRPFFYRLNEIGDVLDCLYVEPSNELWVFECYQILRDPRSDGYIVIGTNKNGQCSMAFYDRQFSKTGSSMPTINGYASLYTRYNSEKWLSQNDMLTFGFARDGRGHGWDLLIADINLDGTVNRYNNILNTPDTSYNISGHHSMAVINDTTIYGLFYLYPAFKGWGTNPGVCLFNINLELLGTRRFLDAKYSDISASSIVAMPDGGCILLCNRIRQYLDTDAYIIRMSREDLNPILCGVSEVPKERLKAMAFPNPTKGELNIDISTLPQNIENRISITDINGITRMCRIIQGSGNLLTIDASSLESGVYLYSIYNSEKEFVKGKFIKE